MNIYNPLDFSRFFLINQKRHLSPLKNFQISQRIKSRIFLILQGYLRSACVWYYCIKTFWISSPLHSINHTPPSLFAHFVCSPAWLILLTGAFGSNKMGWNLLIKFKSWCIYIYRISLSRRNLRPFSWNFVTEVCKSGPILWE